MNRSMAVKPPTLFQVGTTVVKRRAAFAEIVLPLFTVKYVKPDTLFCYS
jgi:hypothetical protein